MKKYFLISLVSIFAVGEAYASGTQNTINLITQGAGNVVTSQAYVDRNINTQVGLETTERVQNEGDLQFSGVAASAPDITGAINAIADAVTDIETITVADTTTIGMSKSAGGEITASALTGEVASGATTLTTGGQVATALGNTTEVGTMTTNAVVNNDMRAVTSSAVYNFIPQYVTGDGLTLSGNEFSVQLANTNSNLSFDAAGGLRADLSGVTNTASNGVKIDGNVIKIDMPAENCEEYLVSQGLTTANAHCVSSNNPDGTFKWEAVLN